jgi:hypothetical protein
MFDDPLVTCPKCMQDKLKRDIGCPRIYVKPSNDECSLGLLADRNSEKLSKDNKEMLAKKYKTKKTDTLDLPGMKVINE